MLPGMTCATEHLAVVFIKRITTPSSRYLLMLPQASPVGPFSTPFTQSLAPPEKPLDELPFKALLAYHPLRYLPDRGALQNGISFLWAMKSLMA